MRRFNTWATLEQTLHRLAEHNNTDKYVDDDTISPTAEGQGGVDHAEGDVGERDITPYYESDQYQAPAGGMGSMFIPGVRDHYEQTDVTDFDRLARIKIAEPDEDDPRPSWNGLPDEPYAYDHTEQYNEIPTGGISYYDFFAPNDQVDRGLGSTPEGEQRFEDLDGSQPLGREYQTTWPEELDYPAGSFEGREMSSFNEEPTTLSVEGEFGNQLTDLVGPGRDSSVMDTSLNQDYDGTGRAASVFHGRRKTASTEPSSKTHKSRPRPYVVEQEPIVFDDDETVNITFVDGNVVRDTIEDDFTMGGNSGRYDFVPKDEVWIEALQTKEDQAATIVHELVERYHMLKDGMSYNKAHEIAKREEERFRSSVGYIGNPLAQAVMFLETLDIFKLDPDHEMPVS